MLVRSSIFLAALAAAGVVGAAPLYSLTDLGFPDLGPGAKAAAINEAGRITGTYYDTVGNARAYVYTPGVGPTDPGTLGGRQSVAFGINSNGQAVGASFTADGRQHAFRYDPATGLHDLGAFSDDPFTPIYTLATGIAEDGTVVGTSTQANGQRRGFAYRAATGMVSLGSLAGAPFADTYAAGINSHGQIVGTVDESVASEAFLYTDGVGMIGLGHLGGDFSAAHAVNEAGDVVGIATTADGSSHPFLYTAARGMVDLRTAPGGYGEAYALNDQGVIVGETDGGPLGSFGLRAFVYTPGAGILDLNGLLDASGAGWTVTSARGVNNAGLIVGQATHPLFGNRAVLLTPVPEPASLAALCLGFLMLRRQKS